MKIEHPIMVIHLDAREAELIHNEIRTLEDKLEESGLTFRKAFPSICSLVDYISMCKKSRAFIHDEPLDKYHKSENP